MKARKIRSRHQWGGLKQSLLRYFLGYYLVYLSYILCYITVCTVSMCTSIKPLARRQQQY